ncbi:MAG: hypothetical protein CVV24_13865 [Ignavibacteriae bacterium HGW-Ignavibacteriae-3]|nr:MAG: hypothetical protein CVV24_13865 [Ignavibacteriae bacterium HGW-Ignavibacteriae-3]
MEKSRLNLIDEYTVMNRPLILDGAMGALIHERKNTFDKNLWSSLTNITDPFLVESLHVKYINAGAQIITTNTFRTNPVAYNKSNLNITLEDFVRSSVGIALRARGSNRVIIAGSNAPAEDCYQKQRLISEKDLINNHHYHITYLWESGVDIIWNETQSHWDEIEIICKFCSENSIPYAMNLYFDDDLKLLSGEPLQAVIENIKEFSPEVIGFNCIHNKLLEDYINKYSLPNNWGFYFNCGSEPIGEGIIHCAISPASFSAKIRSFLNYKPIFIGSCCGSNPEHTTAIKDLMNEVY